MKLLSTMYVKRAGRIWNQTLSWTDGGKHRCKSYLWCIPPLVQFGSCSDPRGVTYAHNFLIRPFELEEQQQHQKSCGRGPDSADNYYAPLPQSARTNGDWSNPHLPDEPRLNIYPRGWWSIAKRLPSGSARLAHSTVIPSPSSTSENTEPFSWMLLVIYHLQ